MKALTEFCSSHCDMFGCAIRIHVPPPLSIPRNFHWRWVYSGSCVCHSSDAVEKCSLVNAPFFCDSILPLHMSLKSLWVLTPVTTVVGFVAVPAHEMKPQMLMWPKLQGAISQVTLFAIWPVHTACRLFNFLSSTPFSSHHHIRSADSSLIACSGPVKNSSSAKILIINLCHHSGHNCGRASACLFFCDAFQAPANLESSLP